MSINKVCISGHLTRDAELRSTQGGTTILTFGMAVNDRRKNPQSGEWEDFPNFVDCVLFGKRADSLSGKLAKGTKVMVEGKLRYSSWEREGQRRSKLEVVVDDLDFASQRGQQQAQGQQHQQQGGYQQYQPQSAQQQYQSAPQQQYQQQGYQQGYGDYYPEDQTF